MIVSYIAVLQADIDIRLYLPKNTFFIANAIKYVYDWLL